MAESGQCRLQSTNDETGSNSSPQDDEDGWCVGVEAPKHCDSDQVPDTSVHFVDSQVIEKYKLCCYLILHLGVPKNLSQISVATHAIASTMAGEHLKIKSSYMSVNQVFVQAASNRGNVLPYRVPVWLLMVDGPLQDIE